MGTIRSLYESTEAAKAAPKLSNDPAAFRHFDVRYGLVTDRKPSRLRIWAGAVLLLLILGFAASGLIG